MDLTLPEELRELVRTTRAFVEERILPIENAIERDRGVPPEVVAEMRRLGFFGLTIPEEHGGLGLGARGRARGCIELGRGHSAVRALISVNNSIGSRAIVTDGTDEQRRRYLPRMASGELLASFALTEPGAGSDAAAITTRATPRDGGFVLEGMKHFITYAPIADVFVTLAVTDPDKGTRGGLTAFVVDKGTPGLRIGRHQETMGSRAVSQAEVFFEECFVPASQVVGEVGWGFRTFMKTLELGRLAIAAAALGNAKRLLELSRAWACDRRAFGKTIGDFGAVRAMLADSATEIYATECMLHDTAWRHERGEDVRQRCSMVKLFAAEMAGRVADRAVQIHGGMGYMSELPVERLYREVRAFRIVEGTSEIQREIIAKHVLAGG
jgi:acyl-CoA dehydrogenase